MTNNDNEVAHMHKQSLATAGGQYYPHNAVTPPMENYQPECHDSMSGMGLGAHDAWVVVERSCHGSNGVATARGTIASTRAQFDGSIQNGDYLYSVIPYCRDRDLFGNEMEIVMREMIPVIRMMDN